MNVKCKICGLVWSVEDRPVFCPRCEEKAIVLKDNSWLIWFFGGIILLFGSMILISFYWGLLGNVFFWSVVGGIFIGLVILSLYLQIKHKKEFEQN